MILHKIAQHAKQRVAQDKKNISAAKIEERALALAKGSFAFKKALLQQPLAVIAEVKKASPSKGVISPDFPYLAIAKEYEKMGAACISVLTEPRWFLGSDDIFAEIRENVTIPMLRKDFTVDSYQIYQAKIMGADCVLLICALLCESELKEYLHICEMLGLNALVEAHDEAEIKKALRAGAQIIGVNNRNLKTFSVNVNNAANLKKHIPGNVLYVAESGIETPEEGIFLYKKGANALLIGEALMKTCNKAQFLKEMMEHCHE